MESGWEDADDEEGGEGEVDGFLFPMTENIGFGFLLDVEALLT